MLEKFLVKTNFESYEDFYNNFKVNVPHNFNFAFDVVDEYARLEPDKSALVWCNDNGEEKKFTFSEVTKYSNMVANYFVSLGIKKGDPVMLILKGRYEYWFCILALHKIGAVAIPATHLLTKKDIIYRNNAADIKMIIAVDDENVLNSTDEAHPESPTLKNKLLLQGTREGWNDFTSEYTAFSDVFERPTGDAATKNDDIMLLYFTSGTTGMPKMVQHNFAYPLGHITTAYYWQNVTQDGLHYTVSDTGWAKAAWGKLYGQWLSGTSIFVYDYNNKFTPKDLLEKIQQYKVTTFCAPPTIYRFLIKEDMTSFDLSSLKYCVVAGEPLNPEIYNKFLSYTGVKLMEGYGQTELTLTIGTFPWMEPKPGSMGRPSPGYVVELLDAEGNVCENGEEGQIVIRTDKNMPLGIFGGYYRDANLTNSVWNDGKYYTGDMVWQDEDG